MISQLHKSPDAVPQAVRQSISENIGEDEFGRQVAGYERLIHAYIFSLVHDWAAADEILQETYVALLKKRHDWQAGTDLYAWIRAFAHNKVLTYRSSRHRDKLRFGEASLARLAAYQAHETEREASRMEALGACMEKLRASDRLLLAMAYGEGREIEEIARDAERSVMATYQVLSRLRRALRNCIERNLGKHSSQ